MNELAKTPGRALYAVSLIDYLLESYAVYFYEKWIHCKSVPMNYENSDQLDMFQKMSLMNETGLWNCYDFEDFNS